MSHPPAIELDGAVVAITGAGRGIGRATAIAFAGKGAQVVLGDLDAASAEAVADEVGPRAHPHHLDVTGRDSVAAFVTAAGEVGPLEVLVNNAGVMPITRFLDESDESSDATLDVNVRGPILGMKLALPGMVARGRGHVVNVASGLGKVPEPGLAVYCASKFAVVGLTASLHDELAGAGVTATAILPTAVKTELVAGVPLERMFAVEPEQVAQVIVGSVESRRPEVWVPSALRVYEPMAALLPAPLMRLVRRALKSDRTLNSIDEDARAVYEERLARQRDGALRR